jgi:predicted nucleic acid-binding protein
MRWLIDSDVFIEGERGNPAFVPWIEAQTEAATADVVRCEFLMGVHAVADAAKRRRGERFYAERIAGMVSLPNKAEDHDAAARMAGEARRQGKGSPSVVDGLLAAIAIRTGATVATRNETDFRAMGCPCAYPLTQQTA